MKKYIFAITVLYIINNANTCIGQERVLTTSRDFAAILAAFTSSREGNAAAAAASIVTNNLPHTTRVSFATKESGERLLNAQVRFGAEWLKGLQYRCEPTIELLKALQNNEKLREPDKSNSSDFLAQVELISFTFNNANKYPNNISPLFNATPSNLFLVKHFPLLAVLMHPNSKYFNEARKATGDQIGTIGDDIVRLTALRANGNASQESYDQLVSQMNNFKKQIALFTDSIAKSDFSAKNKETIKLCLDGLDKNFSERIIPKNEEPDAKRQRTT